MLQIWPEEPIQRNGNIRISAKIEIPGENQKVLWYSIPETQGSFVSDNADHYLVGLIYLILQKGRDVQVHGDVSPSLIRNLNEYQAAWAEWLPNLQTVRIYADRIVEPLIPTDREDAVVAFSGGVDSCFTAFRNARIKKQEIRFKPTAGIMVQGFDIPLDKTDMFTSAIVSSRKLLNSLDMEMIPVSTNYRSLVNDWSHSFGPAVASCLMLFSGRFKSGLIGQGMTFTEFYLLREGSNPLTDPLLSSDSFKIIPDGTTYTRAAKIYSMRDWDEFLKYLRVCWEGSEKDKNCCECEKCIRNMLTFKALGLKLPPCFSKDVTNEQIKTMRLGLGMLPEIRYGKLSSLAKTYNVTGRWIEIIEERLAKLRYQKQTNSLYNLNRFVYYQIRLWNKLMGRG